MSELISAGKIENQLGTPSGPLRISTIFDISIVDSSGIPLLSDRDKPEIIAGIDFKKGPNTFRDSPSRYPDGQPHKTPVSMLERERLAQTYPDFLGITAQVRELFVSGIRRNPRDMDRPLTSREAHQLTASLAYLPYYLVYRGENPFAIHGELPPSVVVLSNAAQGAKAAIGLWQNIHKNDPDAAVKVPNIDESIELAEEYKRLIGEKTVCAASPEQMKHFLSAIVHGPQDTKPRDLDDLFGKGELLSYLHFSEVLTYGQGASAALRALDRDFATAAIDLLNSKSPRQVIKALEQVLPTMNQYIQGLQTSESELNRSLKRPPSSRRLTLNSLEAEYDLKLPGVLRRLRSL